MDLSVKKTDKFCLELDIKSGDKSISHRVCIFSLFADSRCRVKNFLMAEDTANSLKISKKLGLSFEFDGSGDLILTPPSQALREPDDVLYCGNSGTSMRLFLGVLSSSGIYCVLNGDRYLRGRPMDRVVTPLVNAGANLTCRSGNFAPISVMPVGSIAGFEYTSNISSAQVKSALILAGLNARSNSIFREISLSRDHTENMILHFQKDKGGISVANSTINITPFCCSKPLSGFDISIPNDPSSAFFFAVAAATVPGSTVILRNVMLNKTRMEAFGVLKRMGASIEYVNTRDSFERIGDVIVSYGVLNCVTIDSNISWLIDELPALSIAFACAKGISRVRNAVELRVKESDRIKSILSGLMLMGVNVVEYSDGYDIEGGEIRPAVVDSYGDHRVAMSFAVAFLLCGGVVRDFECVGTSFPRFVEILRLFTHVEEV